MIGDKVIKLPLSNATQSAQHGILDYSLFLFDENIDQLIMHCQSSLREIRTIIGDIYIFSDLDQCIDFLTEIFHRKIFLIVAGNLYEQLVPIIHHNSNISSIYVLSSNEAYSEEWMQKWPKIEGIFSSIHPICELLKIVVKQCDQNAIPISFIPEAMITAALSNPENLNKLESKFIYSVLLKKIAIEIDEDEEKAVEALIAFCCQQNISEFQLYYFQRRYYEKSPVWWYTRPMFLYRILNSSLQTFNMEILLKMSFFIRKLHQQLEQLRGEQSDRYQEPFIVYRGQSLSQIDFQDLLKTKGGLLSFNSFLSTSKKHAIAMEFAEGVIRNNEDVLGVIFTITIDPNTISASTSPYALIDDYSSILSEQEILFSINTVFRVIDIKQTMKSNRLWEVQLTIIDENDQQLYTLTNYIKKEVQGCIEWNHMGELMLELGHFNKAEELYSELLKSTENNSDRENIYQHLGYLKDCQGKYKEAISFYEKDLEMKIKTRPEDDISLASMHSNIAQIYISMGDHLKALEYYQKSLKIQEIASPPDHFALAIAYNDIASIYDSMGDSTKALKYYQKSLKILEIALPSSHPDIAVSCSNIGLTYDSMGCYSEALTYYERSVRIMETALPANHRDFSHSYNNIGLVYDNMGNYSKALEYYEKSVKMKAIDLPVNHSDFAHSYNNIGLAYDNMGNYSKALEYYEKSLKILEIAQPPNQFDLATSYTNIAEAYYRIEEYSKSLPYQEMALDIWQQLFLPTHPNVKAATKNIVLLKTKL